jgi:hypothetical protein
VWSLPAGLASFCSVLHSDGFLFFCFSFSFVVASHNMPLPRGVFLLVSNGIERGGVCMFLPMGVIFTFALGLGKHFSVVGNIRRGKSIKMCHVCMRDGLLFFFASALAFQILRSGYSPVGQQHAAFSTSEGCIFAASVCWWLAI